MTETEKQFEGLMMEREADDMVSNATTVGGGGFGYYRRLAFWFFQKGYERAQKEAA